MSPAAGPTGDSTAAPARASPRFPRATGAASGSHSATEGHGPRGDETGPLVAMLVRAEGATIAQIVEATGWQPHTVRGALAGALKKRLGLAVTSEKVEGPPATRRSSLPP